MKPIFLFLAAAIISLGCNNHNQATTSKEDTTSVKTTTPLAVKESLSYKPDAPDAAMQIKLALLAAPPEKRDSCAVYGYDADKKLVEIRNVPMN
ncbi:MAG: hypothetical protein ABI261_08005 [Ginsengibacter sp.]